MMGIRSPRHPVDSRPPHTPRGHLLRLGDIRVERANYFAEL